MKSFLTSIYLLFTIVVFGQVNYPTINIGKKSFSSEVVQVTEADADHALRIANYIFNSKEFKDSLRQMSFNYHNICKGCRPNHKLNKPRIAGTEVLDKLFKVSNYSLTLILEKVGRAPSERGGCEGLGNTCPKEKNEEGYVTSYYDNINCDMSEELPFTYAYAVHICHEYMHYIGYCHTYRVNDDVAEVVGDIAFCFMYEWYKKGIRIS